MTLKILGFHIWKNERNLIDIAKETSTELHLLLRLALVTQALDLNTEKGSTVSKN